MQRCGKLLCASLGVVYVADAVDKVVSVPRWVMAVKSENCEAVCKGAGNDELKKPYACQETSGPKSQADFETILDNIKDAKDLAKCKAYVDLPEDKFTGPAISKGVCWYSSKAKKVDCKAKIEAGDFPVCSCSSGAKVTVRDPIPDPIQYKALHKRAEKASLSFTIEFPFFTKDAFECLGAQAGAKKAQHPESFFKMAYGIKQALGSEAVGIQFVAPKVYIDPLIAKVDVYAAPEDMDGAELFLAKSRVKDIGAYLVKKYPELKMCAYPAKDETYETRFGVSPAFPASVNPRSSWTFARKDEVSRATNLAVHAWGVDVRSLGVASAGVFLMVGAVVVWRRRQEHESVYTTYE